MLAVSLEQLFLARDDLMPSQLTVSNYCKIQYALFKSQEHTFAQAPEHFCQSNFAIIWPIQKSTEKMSCLKSKERQGRRPMQTFKMWSRSLCKTVLFRRKKTVRELRMKRIWRGTAPFLIFGGFKKKSWLVKNVFSYIWLIFAVLLNEWGGGDGRKETSKTSSSKKRELLIDRMEYSLEDTNKEVMVEVKRGRQSVKSGKPKIWEGICPSSK